MSDYLGNPSHLFLRSTAHNGLSGMMQDSNAIENLTMTTMVMMMVTMMMRSMASPFPMLHWPFLGGQPELPGMSKPTVPVSDLGRCNAMQWYSIFSKNTPDLNLNSLFSLYSWHLAFKNKNTRGFWKGNVTLRNRERISLISFYTAREVETRPSALVMSDSERTILGVVCWLVCLFVCFNSTWYNMVWHGVTWYNMV